MNASEMQYVRWDYLRTLSDEELRQVISEGGPAAVGEAARQIINERAAERVGTGKCTCEWEEDEADPEVGPRASISEADEQCPVHGREADPQGWAEGEAMERGYILSGMAYTLKREGIDVREHEARALALHEQHYERQPQPDDGHNVDRACTDAAEALAAELAAVATTAEAIQGMCADWEAGKGTSPDEADYLWAAAQALGEQPAYNRSEPRWRDLANHLYWLIENGKVGNEASNAEATQALAAECVRLVREGKPWLLYRSDLGEQVGVHWGTTAKEALAAYSVHTGFADPRNAEGGEDDYFVTWRDGTQSMVYTNYEVYAAGTTALVSDVDGSKAWVHPAHGVVAEVAAPPEPQVSENACGRCDREWAPGLADAGQWGVYHPANDLWLCPACLDSMGEGEAAAAEHAADNEQPLTLSLRLDDVADLFEAVGFLASIDEGEYTVTERLNELGKLLAKQVPGGIATLLRNGEGVTK
jgi:hypothetical protein